MSNYDDFNLDLKKVNEKPMQLAARGSSFPCGTVHLTLYSVRACSKTCKPGNGCHPTYTKIGPCNRTYIINK